ncbi:MAG: ribonuclease P protein component [Rickettsiales bacterium]|nr:ribonuclease P protein component [Rickettsiales bacterium]
MFEDEDFEETQSPKIRTLKNRKQFLLLSKKGNRISTSGLVLEFAKREIFEVEESEAKKIANDLTLNTLLDLKNSKNSPEIGFTASKKVGSAVYRNKAKRRLREAAREVLKHNPKLFKKNYKFNIIARHSAIDREFTSLVRDLKYALHNVG